MTGSNRGWSELDLVRFLSTGSVLSFGIDFAFYPLKLIKTRLQVQVRMATTARALRRFMIFLAGFGASRAELLSLLSVIMGYDSSNSSR